MQPPQKVRRVVSSSDETNLSANLSANPSVTPTPILSSNNSQASFLSPIGSEATIINGSDKLDKFMKQFTENMDKIFANNCFIQSQTATFTPHSIWNQ